MSLANDMQIFTINQLPIFPHQLANFIHELINYVNVK
jgi:hypothetical protein